MADPGQRAYQSSDTLLALIPGSSVPGISPIPVMDPLYTVLCGGERIPFFTLSRLEGIIPAIESSHAVAHAIRLAKQMKTGSILMNLSGRGDKDMDDVIEHYGIR